MFWKLKMLRKYDIKDVNWCVLTLVGTAEKKMKIRPLYGTF